MHKLFPTARVHINTPTMNDTQSDMDNIEPMFNKQHEHLKLMFHKEVDDEDQMTKADISKMLGPGFFHGKD